MNVRQRKFIEERLIPFILRHRGQGFVMDRTKHYFAPGEKFYGDGIEHKAPDCGTAACVYGSVQVLRPKVQDVAAAADVLGLSYHQAHGLFYNWANVGSNDERFKWPRKYMEAFEKAKTPLAKAKVAVSLLKLVVKTDGECLDRGEKAL